MRNLILSALSAGLLFASALATPASAAVAADINLHIGSTPRYDFARQPRTILIPDTRVYYVSGMDDYDMFQCDGWWYIDDGGYWYRAQSYRGPFVSVSFQSVPGVIMNVPSAYAHQPYRPGVWRSSRNNGGYNGGSYGGSNNHRVNTGWQGRQDANQRWQDRSRNGGTWNRDGGSQGSQGGQGSWNNGNNGNSGNNHGRGNGKGRSNGRGRGHDKGDN